MKISNIKCQKFRVNVALIITGILENTKIMRRKHTLKKQKEKKCEKHKKTITNFKKKKKRRDGSGYLSLRQGHKTQ